MPRHTTLERAFELARSGEVATLEALRIRLNGEGYLDVQKQMIGPSLLRQLTAIIRAANGPAAMPNPEALRRSQGKFVLEQ